MAHKNRIKIKHSSNWKRRKRRFEKKSQVASADNEKAAKLKDNCRTCVNFTTDGDKSLCVEPIATLETCESNSESHNSICGGSIEISSTTSNPNDREVNTELLGKKGVRKLRDAEVGAVNSTAQYICGGWNTDAHPPQPSHYSSQTELVGERLDILCVSGIYPSRVSHDFEIAELDDSTSKDICGSQKLEGRRTTPDSSGINLTQESNDIEEENIVGSTALQVYGGYEIDDTRLAETSSVKRAIPDSSRINLARNLGCLGKDQPFSAAALQDHARTESDSSLHVVVDTCNTHCLESQSSNLEIRQEVGLAPSPKPRDLGKTDPGCSRTAEPFRANCSNDTISNPSDNDSIEDCNSSVACRSETLTGKGRRITDILYFFNDLQKKVREHKCPFEELKIDDYFDRGMRTKVNFSCKKCDYVTSVWSDPEDGPLMGINQSAVCGTITSGVGCSTLEELLASMGVPSMTQTTYRKYRDDLYDIITNVSDVEMKRAAALETEIAIKKGHIINNVPYITVVADGAWAKRSFAGGKHDSLSGVAVIFGHATGLALFVGVRNKYCSVCAKAERQNVSPTQHVCYKNWNCDQSSTSMEKDIIVEGFNASLENHNLIYKTLIADGDSSVYTAIRAANPYAMHGIVVQKIECSNHLFRNMCKKFRIASEKKFPRSIHPLLCMKVSAFRARILSAGFKIRKDVEEARDIRKAEDIPDIEKSKNLQRDVFSVFNHVFGEHSDCNTLPFACEPPDGDVNIIPDLRSTIIYPDVYKAVSDLSCHANSLLQNVTNNSAEACNSIINKCNAGKRTNQCARNSYEIRCHTGALQHNTQQSLSMIHRGTGKLVPLSVLEMERRRSVHVGTNKIHRQNTETKKKRTFVGTDKDYGPSSQKPDVPQDVYDVLVENHLKKLKAYQADRDKIERDTISQSDCDYWHVLRTEMITASNFGTICRMKPSTSCEKMVSSIRLGKMIDTDAVRYGIANEQAAKDALQLKLGKPIMPCGLFIDEQLEYLGATPDGLIDEDGIVEIKCPYSAKDMSLKDAIEVNSNLRNIFEKNCLDSMRQSHVYYYQIQGQLHITGRKYCIFALWTSVDLMYIVVKQDRTFWRTKMQPMLCRFYNDCLLPEIVDSRLSRGMRIRDPDFIVNARNEVNRRKEQIAETKKRKQMLKQQKSEKRTKTDKGNNNISCTLDALPIQTTGDNINARIENESQPHGWIVIGDDGIVDVEEAREAVEVVRRSISVEEVIADVTPQTSLLNDSSIDMFLEIVKENSDFKTFNPACYTAYASLINPCNTLDQDMQIIGGNAFRHWCCLYYNGSELLIYDSLRRGEYEILRAEEKRYIYKRYGHVDKNNIFLMPVTKQPDAYSCGVYSAAFVTSIALATDPTHVSYSRDSAAMRKHLVSIIQNRQLSHFPTE